MSKYVPESVNKLIECSERVAFTGSYLVANRIIQSINDTNGEFVSAVTNIPINVEINPGYNQLVNIGYEVKNILIPPTRFVERNITIASFKEGGITEKTGQISGIALFQENLNGGFISNTVQRFEVISTSGIYKKVTGFIVDFSGPIEEPRTIYFLQDKSLL